MRKRRLELGSLAGALVLASAGACRSPDAWEVVAGPLRATEEATLLPAGDREAYDRFGQSVALSSDGSRALVAAPTDHNGADLYAGSLHVFLRKGMTWTEEATLFGGAGDHFGQAVALSADGSRALVGATGDGAAVADNTGSARVLLRTGTTWAEEATLLASGGAPGDFFGQAVALSADGSWALVGLFGGAAAGGIRSGSVRVFQRTGTTWAEQAAPLMASPSVGRAIALSADGSRALIGVPEAATAGGVGAGSARVFLRTGTTWMEEATLLAADGEADDHFGNSVALSADGSRALVGAALDDTTFGASKGSVRVFLRSGASWTEEATLLAAGGTGLFDRIGDSIALSSDGSRALLGLLFDAVTGGNAGSVRVFGRTATSWTEDATLIAADGPATDYFGIAVALSADGSRALVGASGYNTEAGRAHVFTLAPDVSTGAGGAGGTGGATGAGGTGGATGTGGTGGAAGTAGEGGTTGGTTGTAGSSGGGGGGGDDPKTGSGGCGCDCRVASGAPATVPSLLGIALVLAARRRRRRGPSP